MALLEASGLVLGYGRIDVVHKIDLAVEQGEIACLIGANGAGKTTIMRGLTGLIRPRAGSVRLEGREIAGRPAHLIARAGLVLAPEGRQIFAEMTVAENLQIGAYRDPKDLSNRYEAVAARFPRLRERWTQSAGLLSGGEQQMLALGRALMANPTVLLLDEPSMGLAPLFVEEIFAIIAQLKREGRTVLLVEQNAGAALEIADRAYVLENGRITLSGPAADLANDPHVAAAYLGADGGGDGDGPA